MIDELSELIQQRLEQVKQRISRAARRCGRSPEEITLLVVSKAQPVEVLESALNAGIRKFGENYPEETLPKIMKLQNVATIEWHMIGHLQGRKAKIVAENFSMLHSLDSVGLAVKIDGLLKGSGKRLPCLLEFNIGGEVTKSGWSAGDEKKWIDLLPELSKILDLENLEISGLMTMPPMMEEIEDVRPYFKKIRKLRDYLSASFPGTNFATLSMGTSADFEIAIEEGATIIRVGQAILGARPPRN